VKLMPLLAVTAPKRLVILRSSIILCFQVMRVQFRYGV
jgi:hypothetical protein